MPNMRWACSGGALYENGAVTGHGPLAEELRSDLADLRMKRPASIGVWAYASVDLDTSSNWIVDLWVRQVARRHGETVTTDYVPRDEDIPADVLKLIREPSVPGRIY